METQTYFKAPTKYPYGLTEEQVREAFTMYDKKVKLEIFTKLQSEYPLFFNVVEEDDSILEVILRTIDIATTKGMEMSVNHMDILNYYRDCQREQEKPTHNTTKYEFREGAGISGVLLPNGEFIMCGNAEHYMVVEDINFDVQKECVYFSSFLNGKDGLVTFSPFGDKTMTAAQRHWIDINISYLDGEQKDMYKMLIEE